MLVVLEVEGEQGSGPNEVNALCFHTYGEFFPFPPPPGGWDMDLGPLDLWPQGWDSNLNVKI